MVPWCSGLNKQTHFTEGWMNELIWQELWGRILYGFHRKQYGRRRTSLHEYPKYTILPCNDHYLFAEDLFVIEAIIEGKQNRKPNEACSYICKTVHQEELNCAEYLVCSLAEIWDGSREFSQSEWTNKAVSRCLPPPGVFLLCNVQDPNSKTPPCESARCTTTSRNHSSREQPIQITRN